ncbi:hypothetical protein BZG36_01461 [Bifiguratus adelaidae]|uniref:FAD/NAD(P)-binding domain-containing protein n=1 Tax=Bifiguratus adelaidae TaxID=1938954 RepID=A0A261Y4Y7_9FUNG|nr:hypothetical protein BZG36_01461 [Bifiguratus adelaidae]
MSAIENIVIIGGGFAGVGAVKKLQSMPLSDKYRLILVNASDHFFHIIAALRAAVTPDLDNTIFVPYTSLMTKDGEFVHGKVTKISDSSVTVALHASAERVIDYKYLVIATGAHHPAWAQASANTKEDGLRLLTERQAAVKRAKHIVIIGGGSTGIELAGEIVDFYPEKRVTIVHSGDLLGNQDMTENAKRALENAVKKIKGIEVIRNDAVVDPRDAEGDLHIVTKNGNQIAADLQIVTFGVVANSDIITTLDPNLVNPKTHSIKVKPTLQLDSVNHPNIFAIGDVADAVGSKMAANTSAHVDILAKNLQSIDAGKTPTAVYKGPMGAFAITLGRSKGIIWFPFFGGFALGNYLTSKAKSATLGIPKIWQTLKVQLVQ